MALGTKGVPGALHSTFQRGTCLCLIDYPGLSSARLKLLPCHKRSYRKPWLTWPSWRLFATR